MKTKNKNILRSSVLKATLIAGALMMGVTGANAWTTSPMLWQSANVGAKCNISRADCITRCGSLGLATRANVDAFMNISEPHTNANCNNKYNSYPGCNATTSHSQAWWWAPGTSSSVWYDDGQTCLVAGNYAGVNPAKNGAASVHVMCVCGS